MSHRTWFKNYLKHPLQLGALFPSSPALGSLMVKHIKPRTNGRILELGAGIGSFTNALIRKGVPEEQLVVLEQSKDFTEILEQAFPNANVVCWNAKDLSGILSQLAIENVDEVVSGIPLNAMGKMLREVICDEAFKYLKPGGSFVQVSYLPRCPVPKSVIAKHGGKKIFCGITVRNIPPAFVWRIEKT